MTPTMMVFGREKSFRLGGSSSQTHEDFFLGPGNRTKYTYDKLGRQIADVVTLPSGNPAGIDTTVMEIDHGYDVCGRLQYVTSLDGSQNVVNEV